VQPIPCPERKGMPRMLPEICKACEMMPDCRPFQKHLDHLPYILRLYVELCLEDMAGAMGPVPEGK
jgi:hypothetical protein